MSRADATALTELVDEINDRESLAALERALVRARLRVNQLEQAEREKDPEYVAQRDADRAAAQAEYAREEAREEERRERIQSRLADAEVIGSFTFSAIRPKYLVGLSVPVTGVNEATYRVNIPDTPEFKTWAGRNGVRVPKGSGTFLAGGSLARDRGAV